jgi:gliding motility-associated-like protein
MLFAVVGAEAQIIVDQLTDLYGPGEFRYEVENAPANSVIHVEVKGTVALTAPINTNTNVQVIGPGPIHFTLNGVGLFGAPIFNFNSTGAGFFTVDGITLQNSTGNGIAILPPSFVSFENCVFESFGNSAVNNQGTATFENCTFSDNIAIASGGAIFNTSVLTARNCTFFNNRANTSGGAVYTSNGTVDFVNCTFYVNDVISGSPGTGGAIFGAGGIIQLQNNIFFQNGNNIGLPQPNFGDVGAGWTSIGGNYVDSDLTTVLPFLPFIGSDVVFIGADPLLQLPIITDGYGLRYFPLQDGSPAIELGVDPSNNLPTYDVRRSWRKLQSGWPLPGTQNADAGAVEWSRHTVRTNAGDNSPQSLGEAVNDINLYSGPFAPFSIVFELPTGIQNIDHTPYGPYYIDKNQTTINGFTQDESVVPGPGVPGSPATSAYTPIEINGNGGVTDGFIFISGSNESRISGLALQNHNESGIKVEESNIIIEGNNIGTDASGINAQSNVFGVTVAGTAGSVHVGGNNYLPCLYTSRRNVISASLAIDVRLEPGINGPVFIHNNFIGPDGTGMVIPTGAPANNGIEISGGINHFVGGSSKEELNVISGHNEAITIASSMGSINTAISGNFIGTDATGVGIIGNAEGIILDVGTDGLKIGGVLTSEFNVISGNGNNGIVIYSFAAGGPIDITGNIIGLDVSGTVPLGNGIGINLDGATGIAIGDGTFAGRNIISANNIGIEINSPAGGFSNIVHNYVGVNINGDHSPNAVGNLTGINVIGSAAGASVVIGNSAGQGNVISGNGEGIVVDNTVDYDVDIYGNIIGLAASGLDSLLNGSHLQQIGITINTPNLIDVGNSSSFGSRNIITGNDIGVEINGDNQVIHNAIIGLDKDGNDINIAQRGNHVGIEVNANAILIGGTDVASRNFISNNVSDGIYLNSGTGINSIFNNYIGTDTLGLAPYGNGLGIIVDNSSNNFIGGNTAAEGNVISANGEQGILIVGALAQDNSVHGNYIGTDVTGTSPLGNGQEGILIEIDASGNLVGGGVAANVNVISGNAGAGVMLSSDANSNNVFNNIIGADVSGTLPIPNDVGVVIDDANTNTIGSNVANNGNVISANTVDGVEIFGPNSHDNIVLGNWIGQDKIGNTIGSGNGENGVRIHGGAYKNTIGGGTLADGNIISGHATSSSSGIRIEDADTNFVFNNIIGLNETETAARPNHVGVQITGSSAENQIGGAIGTFGNVISANDTAGVLIDGTAHDNFIRGNFIGTDFTGNTPFSNNYFGIAIQFASNNTIGGDVFFRNIISGHAANPTAMGIGIDQANNNLVSGNYIGLFADGTAYPNYTGIVIRQGSDGNVIGGTTANEQNVISGNTETGVLIETSSINNKLEGNYIGINPTGTGMVPNNIGVAIASGAQTNFVGTSSVGGTNVITGNTSFGVIIVDSGTDDNEVRNNIIGLNPAGTGLVPGVRGDIGVMINNDAQNNFVGGDKSVDEGNVITGHDDFEVTIDNASNNFVQGNIIGLQGDGDGLITTDALAAVFVNNNSAFNTIGGDPANGEGNTIANFVSVGIEVNNGSNNDILGNFIGVNELGNASRTAAINAVGIALKNGANNNIIGTSSFMPANVISGMTQGVGIQIMDAGTSNNLVLGNYLGLDALGINPISSVQGVLISNGATSNDIGGVAAGEENFICHSDGTPLTLPNGYGIAMINTGTSNNKIFGNHIGVDIAGNVSGANQIGVAFWDDANYNFVGGTGLNEGNIIAFNDVGVQVGDPLGGPAATGITILSNSIFNNTELGIDLYAAADPINMVTANDGDGTDADAGNNDLQNFPTILSAFECASSGVTSVSFRINGNVADVGNSFVVEFYTNTAADPSGNGEGETFIDRTTVILSSVTETFIHNIPLQTVGTVITSTVSHLGTSSTSEFGDNYTITSPPADPDVMMASGITGPVVPPFCENDIPDSLQAFNYVGTPVWFADNTYTTRLDSGEYYSFPWTSMTPTWFYVADSLGGCYSALDSIQITIQGAPTAVDAAITECENPVGSGTATLDLTTIDNTVNGGSGDAVSWFSNSTASTPIVSPGAHTTGSTIVYAVVDNGSCTDTAMVTITINPSPNPLATGGPNAVDVLCYGDCTGSASFPIAGGYGTAAPYTISWDDGNIGSDSRNDLCAGPHFFVVVDNNGCTDTAFFTINEPGPITGFTTLLSDVSCNAGNDGSATVAVSGGVPGYNYTWIDVSTNGTVSNLLTPTNLTAGDFFCIITDANGCSVNSDTVTVSEPPALGASHTDVSPDCNGAANGSITVTATGGVTPYLYSDDGIIFQGSNVFSGLTAGSYTITVEDANGCQTVLSGVVLVDPPALSIIQVSTSDPLCFGDSNGSIVITASGGTGTLQYSIDNGVTFQASNTFNGLPGSSYDIVVEDINGCQVSTSPVVLNNPPQLTITGIATADPTCNGNSDGIIIISTNGGTGTIQYSIDNGVTFTGTATFTGLAAGIYDVVVEDANGCQASGQTTLTDPAPVVISNVTTFDPLCNGDANGSIDITASGGVPPLQYSIDNGVTFQAGNLFTGLTGGTYDVVVADASGCTASVPTTSLTDPTALSFTAVNTADLSCNSSFDGSITIFASGGTPPIQYSIDNGISFQASGSFTGLPAGTYDLVIEDNNLCFDTLTVVVNEPPAIVITNINTTDPSCAGVLDGSIDITVTGGTTPYTYSIDNGVTYQAPNVFSGLGGGSFDIVVSDANSCTASGGNVTLTDPPAIVLDSADLVNPLCNGDSNGSITLHASGGAGGLQYSIDNGVTFQGTNLFTGLAGISYNVVIVDANGCQFSTSLALIDPLAVAINNATHNDPLCNGDTNGDIDISATGGTGALQYSIDNGVTFQPGNIFTGLGAGTYDCVVEDINGCSDNIQVILVDPTVITIDSIQVIDATCNGFNNGSIVIWNTSGGVPSYDFSIDNGLTTQPTNTFTGLTAGNYDVVVIDNNGCTANFGSVTLSEPLALNYNPTITSPTCFGATDASITFGATTGGTPPYQYSIDNGATFQASNTFTGLLAGNYPLVVEDANGCQINSILGQPTNPPQVIATVTVTDPSCNGFTDGEINITGSGGDGGPYTYSIDAGATYQSSSSYTGLGAGSFDVTIVDAGGCNSDTTNYILTDPPLLVIDTVIAIPDGCGPIVDGSLVIQVSGGTSPYDYSIDNGVNFFATAAFLSLGQGTYNIVVKDANGCTAATQATITEILQPAPPVVTPTSINFCQGDVPPLITASGLGTFNWYYMDTLTGQIFTDTTAIRPTQSGTYYITQSIGGCESFAASVTVSLTAYTGSTSLPQTACDGDALVLQAFGGDSYQWYPDTTINDVLNTSTITVNPVVNNIYYVDITIGNCVFTDSVIVVVDPDCSVDITNAFSPDGDGTNDTWIIPALLRYPDNQVTIFNRWGDVLVKFTGYDNQGVVWNGTNKSGDQLPMGTYYYIVEVFGDDERQFNGWVQIMK